MKFIHKEIFEKLDDSKLMGLCIEREAGGEIYEGKVAVGTVILERVDHRKWDGNSIHEVILKPWQFTWTMPQDDEDYYNRSVKIASHYDTELKKGGILYECYTLARLMIAGEVPRDPELAAVNCCQYLNPIIAAKTKRKWLAAGMKVIKAVDHHEFFV